MAEKLHTGHRQRMREKFSKTMNFENFPEHEILEMLLFYCYPQRNTNDIAHKLINKYGSLAKVLEAPLEDLKRSGIIGENVACHLKFFNGINNYLQVEQTETDIDFCDIPQLKTYVRDTFSGVSHEQFKLYFTDNNYKIKSFTDVSTGTEKTVDLKLRSITRAVLNSGSGYFFVAHNHPQRLSTPSDEDVLLTRKIITHLREMDIHLLDHFVVGTDGVTSMRQSGLIYDHE